MFVPSLSVEQTRGCHMEEITGYLEQIFGVGKHAFSLQTTCDPILSQTFFSRRRHSKLISPHCNIVFTVGPFECLVTVVCRLRTCSPCNMSSSILSRQRRVCSSASFSACALSLASCSIRVLRPRMLCLIASRSSAKPFSVLWFACRRNNKRNSPRKQQRPNLSFFFNFIFFAVCIFFLFSTSYFHWKPNT